MNSPQRPSASQSAGPASGPESDPQSNPGSSAAPDVLVTLVGKPGCHLCDAARAVVIPVCDELGARFEELSVLDDPVLADRYFEFIPVVLIDGQQHDFYRVDAGRLRAAVRAHQA